MDKILSLTTQAQYLRRAALLEDQATVEIKQADPGAIRKGNAITPMQLVVWLVKTMRGGSWAASTWRQYKASIIHTLSVFEHEENPEAIEYLRPISYSPEKKVSRKRTSSTKSKHIKVKNMERVLEKIVSMKSETAQLTAMWVTCTYHSGLRPCEWETAQLVQRENGLSVKVRNAKNTNGRAHGDFRHVYIGYLPEETLETFRTFMATLAHHLETTAFSVLYGRVRKLISEQSKKVLTKRHSPVALYTFRHQFIANAKRIATPREVGALSGHAVDDTCTTHYGRAEFGHDIGTELHADPAEVDRVRVTGKAYNPHSHMENQQQDSEKKT